MGSRCRTNQLKTLVCGVAIALIYAGCSDAVQLTHETEAGGVVTYVFKEERGGPMGSPYRKDAVNLMDKKCPAGYLVIRDGEVKGYGITSSMESLDGEVTGRRWGIQFRCK